MRCWHHNQQIQRLKEFCQRYYLPLVLGVIATIAVLGMWQHLLRQEQLHTHQLVQQEATAIEIELSQKLSTRLLTLEQMASRWQFNGGTPRAAWQADAAQYIEDFSGYQAIEWVDPAFHVRWIVPVKGNEVAQNLDLSQESRRQITLSIARDLHQTLLTRTVTLAQGGTGMLVVVPLFVKDHSDPLPVGSPAESLHERFDGFIVGVFRFQSLFDSILTTSPHYQVQILDHNGLIYSQGTPSTIEQPGIGIVQAYGADWQVQVFPTSEFVAAGRSLLSTLVLWGGLAGTWALALLVYLSQHLRQLIQQVRKSNQQLQREIVKRQQIELERRQSETRYRQLANHINVGFVIHAPDTHILQCNPTACELLGLSMEQMLGKEAIEPTWHFAREDGTVMPIEEYPVNRVLATQAPLENYVLGINRGTQPQTWVLVTAFPEFDTTNQLKQIVVTFIDISQLKRVETDLREMAKVMEYAISGISKLDAEGHYLYVNRTYADMTGYQPEEMLGMSWHGTVHPDDLAALNTAYQQMRQDGRVEVEARGLRKDGSIFYKQLVMVSSYDEQQQFVGHYCFMKDISEKAHLEAERKIAETALQDSESTLRSFFNNKAMLMGIVELRDNNILHLSDNQTAATFFGTTPAAMRNRFASEMGVPRSHLQRWIQAYREAEQTQATVHFEYPHASSTGGHWLAANVCQIANSSSQYSRFSYIVEDITERKQTELALENELMRSQMLFSTSIDGIVVMNHQGDVVQTSPSFAQMLGYTVEETLNLNVVDWDAQWARDELQEILERNILPPLFETSHRRKDGSLYDVEISYSRAEVDGEMMHFCICRDISDRKRSDAERKQAEIALQSSQARFAGILEIASDAIISVNANQQITLFNKGAENIFGYQAEEVLGQPLALLMPDRFAQAHHHHVNHYAQGESNTRQMAQRGAIFGRRKDGTEFPAEASISKLNINGEITFTTFLRDITARQQAESAIAHLAAIIESSEDAIISKSLEGIVTSWNVGAEMLFGYTAAEIVGQLVKVLIPGGLLDEETAILKRIRDGESVSSYDTQRRRKDGVLIDVSISVSPIKNPEGMIIGASKIARDIRDRKQKEIALRQAMEAAEAANLAKSMFLANMSHELRTPLNVILGFSQVMSHDLSLTPGQLEDLQTIRRSGDYLLSLINDVLDLSKIEAGHCTLEESGFDLISLLHTLRTMMTERSQAKQLQLTFDIAPEVPQFVMADEQKLRQILLNLLSNAIKFTKQGSVTLQVTSWESTEKNCVIPHSLQSDDALKRLISTPACTLQFKVTDTGVGIAETEQASIFDAFTQAEAGRKSVSGTGLGLTISRKLLELMNGNISVESTLGIGSTFTVTVPVCLTSGVDGQAEQPERTIIGLVPGQPHRRILVVDDQLENRKLMVRLLTHLGLEVAEATNGQEAIDLWQRWQPDLTWMDIRMPVLDGYEATKQIRAMEPEQASIIIALTAQASQSDRTLALAAGCNDYISKPFREETLFLKLREYLGLEYLYAESETSSNSPSMSSPAMNTDDLASFDANRLAQLPPDWLDTLEDLALCCNDRAIVDLANQLSPEFDTFKMQLLDLANRFEFEQIVHLIHYAPSS
jgi:PAS domain S-box-containing protein